MVDRLRKMQVQATLEQVPDQGFYLSGDSSAGKKAIEALKQNPALFTVNGTWSLSQGEYYVPMIHVNVGEETINLDRRAGLGLQIYNRFLEDIKKRRAT